MNFNKVLIFSAAAVFFAACGGKAESGEAGEVANAGAAAATYTVDSSSNVGWEGTKLFGMGGHNGTFGITEGSLSIEEGTITAGNFTINMTAIKVNDLTPETGAGDLIGHLSAPDFFDVAKYPTAKFEITEAKAEVNGENTHVIAGNLTIKDSTRAVSFPAKVTVAGDNVTATGTLTINRLDWGINYNSGEQGLTENAVKATKNGVVGKDVKITVNLSATKEATEATEAAAAE
jgi:polyisoprenoid-binding protein YceI